MNFFKRRAILKKINSLDLIPIRIVTEEIESNNNVTLLMPKFTSKFAQSHIVQRLKKPYIKIKLDELGSATWLLIDGEKHTGTIINELTQKFGDKAESAEDRVVKFLSFLYNQKFIIFKQVM